MYRRRTIGSFAEVKGGKRLPDGHDLVSSPTVHPYIRARDIRGGTVTFDEPSYLLEETFQQISRYTVSPGDVCVTIVGANVGDVGRVPDWLDQANLTENAAKVTDLKSFDSRFLTYALLERGAQDQMKLLAGGAAQPKLGLYKIKDVEVFAPDLPIQHRIANILSAYDDLIENNTKRIKILEEMAPLAVPRVVRELPVPRAREGEASRVADRKDAGGVDGGNSWRCSYLAERVRPPGARTTRR